MEPSSIGDPRPRGALRHYETVRRRKDGQLIDVSLTVGQLAETVAVEASVPVVSTDSATVGNVIDNKQVTELPLNGRYFIQLNILLPGANQGVKGSQNQTQGGSISINGARAIEQLPARRDGQ